MNDRPAFDLLRLTETYEHSVDCVQLIDPDGRLLWVNRPTVDGFGLSEDAVGTDWASHWPEEVAVPLRAACDAQEPAAAHVTAARTTVRDRSVWWDVSIVPVNDPMGWHVGHFVTCRDVTLRETQNGAREILLEEMRHRQSNTLALASTLISLHGRDKPELGTFVDEMSKRLAAMGRAQAVVARRDNPSDGVHDVQGLLGTLVRPLVGPTCELVIDVEPGIVLPASRIDVVGMVLSELAVNSAKHGAFLHGGRVALSVVRTGEGIEFSWQERSDVEVAACQREGGMGQKLMNRFAAIHDGAFEVTWRPRGQLARLMLSDDQTGISAA